MAAEEPQFQNSVKLEQTAKGARITVHCYDNDPQKAQDTAIGLYESTLKKLQEKQIPVAPIEKGRGE